MVVELESYYAGKRVFVTGAAGFIGSHLVERLADLGAEVTALVRYNSRNDIGFLRELTTAQRERVQIVFGDVRDLDSMRRSIGDNQIVLHLASIISIPYSYVRPVEVMETNVNGTLNALLSAHEKQVIRFVQTSSSEVYGSAVVAPIEESHPRQPQSVYSAAKISADALALSFYYSYQMPVSVCRPFNTFGPRQSDRAVIPAIIAQLQSRKELKLGNVWPTRDFTYVSDTVEGMLRVAACDEAVGKEVQLGTGQEISIGDLAQGIGKLMDVAVTIEADDIRVRPSSSEVARLVSSNALARSLTGWMPEVSLDEGLKRTIDWVRDRKLMYDSGSYRI